MGSQNSTKLHCRPRLPWLWRACETSFSVEVVPSQFSPHSKSSPYFVNYQAQIFPNQLHSRQQSQQYSSNFPYQLPSVSPNYSKHYYLFSHMYRFTGDCKPHEIAKMVFLNAVTSCRPAGNFGSLKPGRTLPRRHRHLP